MQEMQIKIEEAGFEGPLDLLLHLIKHLEIDIYDIPMSEITDQYLLYIHTMKELELDVASEYLVMAATLLAIKSQMILPKHEETLDDEDFIEDFVEDPRDELVARLIEYRKFKEAADELKEKEQERALMYTKPPSDLSEYALEMPVEPPGENVTIYDMLGAFHKLIRRQRLKKPLHTRVTRQEVSIEDRMKEVYAFLSESDDWIDFYHIFPYPSKEHIVVTFLALLELMRQNKVYARQDTNFSDLLLKAI